MEQNLERLRNLVVGRYVAVDRDVSSDFDYVPGKILDVVMIGDALRVIVDVDDGARLVFGLNEVGRTFADEALAAKDARRLNGDDDGEAA